MVLLSVSGTFNIFVKIEGAEKLVGSYDKGSFGELALMYNTPRAATIIATSPGAVWCLVSKTLRTHAGAQLAAACSGFNDIRCAVSWHSLNKRPGCLWLCGSVVLQMEMAQSRLGNIMYS